MQCQFCRFWQRCDNHGECRVNPPMIHAQLQSRINDRLPPESAVWPWTRAADWCGSFQPAETKEEQ